MSPTFRALRIGVLLGDLLVEERVIRSDQAQITFGQSLRCTFSIPADGVPAAHVLFTAAQGAFTLHATESMTGRLVYGDAEVELHAGAIAVRTGARGKLRIGDATVLFQELAAPPIAPRMQLPASVRSGLADRIDRRLATIVAASLVAHLGIATWAHLTEREGAATFEDAAAQYDPPRYEIIDMPDIEVPTPALAPTTEPGIAAPVKPEVQIGKPKPTFDKLPETSDPDEWSAMLTSNKPSSTGASELPNLMPDTELDKQIQKVREGHGDVVARRPTSRDRDPRIGDGPGGPNIGDPRLDPLATKQEKKPIARLTPVPQPKPPGRDPLPINLVLGRIQNQYMAGLQRCYVKHGLAFDSSLVAKVTISFVVDSTGASTENQAHGANAEVDGCIHEQMAGWRFPVPKDDDGDPTDAPFKLQLALQPS